ncbi:unnamed protein product [Musa textilis]
MESSDLQRRYIDFTSTLFREEVVDFKKVAAHVHQLKGSSARFSTPPMRSLWFVLIRAQRVKNVCMAFRICCEETNREGCLGCLQQVRQEYFLVKSKLETVFRLEQQIVAAGGSIPTMW